MPPGCKQRSQPLVQRRFVVKEFCVKNELEFESGFIGGWAPCRADATICGLDAGKMRPCFLGLCYRRQNAQSLSWAAMCKPAYPNLLSLIFRLPEIPESPGRLDPTLTSAWPKVFCLRGGGPVQTPRRPCLLHCSFIPPQLGLLEPEDTAMK